MTDEALAVLADKNDRLHAAWMVSKDVVHGAILEQKMIRHENVDRDDVSWYRLARNVGEAVTNEHQAYMRWVHVNSELGHAYDAILTAEGM